jgi:hypothetical protein
MGSLLLEHYVGDAQTKTPLLFKYSYISLISWAFVLFGIDWILEIVLASVTGIDSTTTTTFLPVVYDTKHLLPLLYS